MPGSKDAVIICIGSEITRGFVQETLAKQAASDLYSRGYEIRGIHILPDFEEDIEAVLFKVKTSSAEFVLVTGGLGPTQDDLTRDLVARAAGVALSFHEAAWADFLQRYPQLDENANRKQGLIPQGFTYLSNEFGTASAFYGIIGKQTWLCLPGVPSEFKGLWEHYSPGLTCGSGREKAFFTALMIGESNLQKTLLETFPDIFWHTEASIGKVVFGYETGSADPAEIIACLENKYPGSLVYQGRHSPAAFLIDELEQRNMTIAFAESCTGGAAASGLTEVSGASKVLWGGWVVYDNKAKIALGVNPDTLQSEGAVSGKTVVELARYARQKSGVSVAVSISGIAGPDGGTEEKPVGTVWIGYSGPDGEDSVLKHFRWDRNRIRTMSVYAAYAFVLSKIRRGKQA